MTKILLIFFITTQMLFAGVSASVDMQSVEEGEMVTYSLQIAGESVKRPEIATICDSDVLSTSSQTNMQIINGSVSKNYTLNYKFAPQKSCKIESFEIEIDGKKERTKEIEISVKAPSQTKDANFMLLLHSDKKELYVSEAFELTLLFKQKDGSNAIDSKFTPPAMDGFWVREESKPQKYQEDGYTVTKVVYTLLAQRVGMQKIGRAKIQIASRDTKIDGWGGWIPTIKWKNHFSNELDLSVKPLPSGVSLVGDFTITLSLDKAEVNANEALDATVSVSGSGNLEDIKSFKPNIPNVAVFDEKIVIDGKKLSQKLTFVAESDFMIPPLKLTYFDINSKEIKTITTNEIAIKVKNQKPKEELTIKKPEEFHEETLAPAPQDKSDAVMLFFVFFTGLVVGAALMMFKKLPQIKKAKKSSIKEPKALLAKLMAYKEDAEVKRLIEILEKNIYTNDKTEIDKKVLKEVLKRYKLD
ncbi:BatD family protein [Sulfurimonas sp.]|uniref:BatD family protein n=1 Tax=Sulfurimonas sp. TaxID=2022749 RepID=UPI0026154A5E|nr:BatD family protein [Sulfurimonas sp.]MDD3451402.1 BatD family protein [Sulfurimonas sp.]